MAQAEDRMSRHPNTEDEIQEAQLLGRALVTLRMSCGMTQRQVAARAGITAPRLSTAENGRHYPRQAILKRILDALGVTFAALHRAQELVEDPMGESDTAIDAPDFTAEEAHQAAVRLAQEAGKAVAHCCLAFMEVGAKGWRPPAAASGNGRARATRQATGK
jgi:transcriptional regulator with XRE-family HTH domain